MVPSSAVFVAICFTATAIQCRQSSADPPPEDVPTAPVSVFILVFSHVFPVLGPPDQVQTQVEQIDEKHNVSGKFAAAAMNAQAKVQEVDTK